MTEHKPEMTADPTEQCPAAGPAADNESREPQIPFVITGGLTDFTPFTIRSEEIALEPVPGDPPPFGLSDAAGGGSAPEPLERERVVPHPDRESLQIP